MSRIVSVVITASRQIRCVSVNRHLSTVRVPMQIERPHRRPTSFIFSSFTGALRAAIRFPKWTFISRAREFFRIYRDDFIALALLAPAYYYLAAYVVKIPIGMLVFGSAPDWHCSRSFLGC